MGGSGSVQWMFQQWGIIRIEKSKIKMKNLGLDIFELGLIEAGAEDIYSNEEEFEIKTKVENLQKVLIKIKEMGIESDSSGIEWVAKEKLSVSSEITEKLQSLFADLEDHDDVEDYFTNAE